MEVDEKAYKSAPEECRQGTIETRSEGAKDESAASQASDANSKDAKANPPREIGGPKGLEPTRYGDWEKGGRCIDF
jgi:hypothetical protein